MAEDDETQHKRVTTTVVIDDVDVEDGDGAAEEDSAAKSGHVASATMIYSPRTGPKESFQVSQELQTLTEKKVRPLSPSLHPPLENH